MTFLKLLFAFSNQCQLRGDNTHRIHTEFEQVHLLFNADEW